ncbi:Binary cytotoxin component [Pseudomonas tremae]|uniref:Binary cytotoxin component n=3 Tax=Pseudomonas syringae group TaxID=136849 RepID=A0AB37QGS6_9PSED|nr:Binary cytotoxin component [Pseudomonas coronafaciens pv. garcae]KPZ00759.1 Binary cytotoxin component [Pseudomonas tremae]KPZ20735.1 Binary cytotoxin component [Pseudomonas coronafaciens pv. zizaniae]RMN95269.1 Binary cytotoxin component [Pseudomonas coronafaciens pv. coronafaciens]RMS97663.1 Binary cytotoxin component [Pseudomonas coronafaciens pv. oryzae]
MMNVHVLDTPFQLPAPNMEVLVAGREKLKQQADALGDIYLPVMMETLRSLLIEVGNVDKNVLDTLTLVPHGFNSDEMLPYLEAVEQLKGQSDDTKRDAAVAEFNKIISTLLDEKIVYLANHAKVLDKALANLNAVQVDAVDYLAPALDQEIIALGARLAAENTRLDEVSEQAAVVNALITDLENLNIFDRLKPLVASLEKLADIDPRSPLIGSIKAGIVGVSNILNLLDAAVDYDHLLALRDRLQAQLTDRQETIGDTRAALAIEVGKRDQLSGLVLVHGYRGDYAREVEKLHAALSQVLSNCLLPATDTSEERVTHFSRQANALNTYLVDLRGDWRS